MKTETETGATLLQAKECKKPSETGRNKEGFSPGTSEKGTPCQKLAFRHLVSVTVRNEFLLFEVMQLLITHYSVHRYPTQRGSEGFELRFEDIT